MIDESNVFFIGEYSDRFHYSVMIALRNERAYRLLTRAARLEKRYVSVGSTIFSTLMV